VAERYINLSCQEIGQGKTGDVRILDVFLSRMDKVVKIVAFHTVMG
jgi:hypothetical protein